MKFSEATQSDPPLTTDSVPIARFEDATSRRLTLQGIVNWIVSVFPFATPTEARAGTEAAKALTPASVGPQALIRNANGSMQKDAVGDARGANALDLQTTRSNVNQVASGVNSVILSGTNNRIAVPDAVVITGDGNIAGTGANGVAIIGDNNTDNTPGSAPTGISNSLIVGNSNNMTTGSGAGVLVNGSGHSGGRDGARVSGTGGKIGNSNTDVLATSYTTGHQIMRACLRASTSTATPTNMVPALGEVFIPNLIGEGQMISVKVYAWDYVNQNRSASFERRVTMYGSTIVDTQVIGIDYIGATLTASIALSADVNGFYVTVTGALNQYTLWTASVECVQVRQTP